jgi:hypothetical protein
MKWLPAAGLLGLVAVSRGETINFYNPTNQTNLTSAGQDMDGGFVFQLGVFEGGFIPSRNNITEWAGKWASAMSAGYDTGSKAFDENLTVAGNPAPFLPGASAYVWGKRTSSTGDEWILFRKADWTWPSPNPFNPLPPAWNAAQADEVIIGSINGPGHLMKSEAVVSYSQWQTAALAGEPLDLAADDPDHDGVPNLLEFVFGSPPKQAGPPPPLTVSIMETSGQRYLQISIPRLRERMAVLTVMVSDDLTDWQSGPSHTTEVSSAATSLVVRDLTPLESGQPRRFMRLKAVLP